MVISEDPRFDSSVDQLTGYRTCSVLCMPVCNYEGTVIGVAEIINKKNGTNEFTAQDVEVTIICYHDLLQPFSFVTSSIHRIQ